MKCSEWNSLHTISTFTTDMRTEGRQESDFAETACTISRLITANIPHQHRDGIRHMWRVPLPQTVELPYRCYRSCGIGRLQEICYAPPPRCLHALLRLCQVDPVRLHSGHGSGETTSNMPRMKKITCCCACAQNSSNARVPGLHIGHVMVNTSDTF